MGQLEVLQKIALELEIQNDLRAEEITDKISDDYLRGLMIDKTEKILEKRKKISNYGF